MNKNEIFQVSRDEYVGFLDQIRPDCRVVDEKAHENNTIFKVYSKKTKKLLCSRIQYTDNNEPEFYVYEMPDDDEMQPPTPKRKIILQIKEEVQAFFDAISKIQNERTVS